MKYVGHLITAIKILAGLVHLLAWANLGFRCPRYIHILAGVGFCVGVGVGWMAPEQAPVNEAWFLGKWWMAFFMSAFVYVAFGFFGGAAIIREREEREAERDVPPSEK